MDLGNVKAGPEKAERQLQIPRNVKAINSKVNCLTESFSELRSRLAPVLDEQALLTVDEEAGRSGGTPLAVELEDIEIRISDVTSSLIKVIKALEI